MGVVADIKCRTCRPSIRFTEDATDPKAIKFTEEGMVGGKWVVRGTAVRKPRRQVVPPSLRRATSVAQRELLVLHFHPDLAAALELAEQDLVGERLLQLGLDQPRHRPRAELRVEAVLGEPVARLGRQLERHLLLDELRRQLADQLVDDLADDLGRQRVERDPRVEAVAELGANVRSIAALPCSLRARRCCRSRRSRSPSRAPPSRARRRWWS